MPVTITQRLGDPTVVSQDEGIWANSTIETVGKLAQMFTEGRYITAGNASQIFDGTAVVIVASRGATERFGVKPIAELVGYGQVAGLLHRS